MDAQLSPMVLDLFDASRLLKDALDQYRDKFLTFERQCEANHASKVNSTSSTILDESSRLGSYKATINEVESALTRLRNHCRNIAPVNSLPAELLIRIFRLACQTEHCILPSAIDQLKYPYALPTCLLYVCSDWRSLALQTHDLWTHIDLVPYHVLSSRLIPYARHFAARSGGLALDIHVNTTGPGTQIHFKESFLKLCATVAKKAKSITLIYSASLPSNVAPVISKLLANSVPGQLSKIVTKNVDTEPSCFHRFIMSQSNMGLWDDVWAVGLTTTQLEQLTGPTSSLRLDNVYFYWGSQAYAGLVDLHLTDTVGKSATMRELSRVLRASPGLRFFYFSSGFIDDRPADPAHLTELEVLTLVINCPTYDNLLRLIIPGSKPLRMSISISTRDPPSSIIEGEFGQLIMRSKLSQFHAGFTNVCFSAPLNLFEVTKIVPDLQVLVLEGFEFELPTDPDNAVASSQPTELRITSSFFSLDVISWIAKAYPATEVTIEEATMRQSSYRSRELGVWEWEKEFLNRLPMVKLVDKVAPVEKHWD